MRPPPPIDVCWRSLSVLRGCEAPSGHTFPCCFSFQVLGKFEMFLTSTAFDKCFVSTAWFLIHPFSL